MRQDYRRPGRSPDTAARFEGARAIQRGLTDASQAYSAYGHRIKAEAEATQKLKEDLIQSKVGLAQGSLDISMDTYASNLIGQYEANPQLPDLAKLGMESFEAGLSTIIEEINGIEDKEVRKRILGNFEATAMKYRARVSSNLNDLERRGSLIRLTRDLDRAVKNYKTSFSIRRTMWDDSDGALLTAKEETKAILSLGEGAPTAEHAQMVVQGATDNLLRHIRDPATPEENISDLMKEIDRINPGRDMTHEKTTAQAQRDATQEAEIKTSLAAVDAIVAAQRDSLYGESDEIEIDNRLWLAMSAEVGQRYAELPEVADKISKKASELKAEYEADMANPNRRVGRAMADSEVRSSLAEYASDSRLGAAYRAHLMSDEITERTRAQFEIRLDDAENRARAAFNAAIDRAHAILEPYGVPRSELHAIGILDQLGPLMEQLEKGTAVDALASLQGLLETTRELGMSSQQLAQDLSGKLSEGNPSMAVIFDMMALNTDVPHYKELIDAYQKHGSNPDGILTSIRTTLGDDARKEVDKEMLRDRVYRYYADKGSKMGQAYRAMILGSAYNLPGSKNGADSFLNNLRDFRRGLNGNVGPIVSVNGDWLRLPKTTYQPEPRIGEFRWAAKNEADEEALIRSFIDTTFFEPDRTWEAPEGIEGFAPGATPGEHYRGRIRGLFSRKLEHSSYAQDFHLDFSKVELPAEALRGINEGSPLFTMALEYLETGKVELSSLEGEPWVDKIRRVLGGGEKRTGVAYLAENLVREQRLIGFRSEGEVVKVYWRSGERGSGDMVPFIYDGEHLTYHREQMVLGGLTVINRVAMAHQELMNQIGGKARDALEFMRQYKGTDETRQESFERLRELNRYQGPYIP